MEATSERTRSLQFLAATERELMDKQSRDMETLLEMDVLKYVMCESFLSIAKNGDGITVATKEKDLWLGRNR